MKNLSYKSRFSSILTPVISEDKDKYLSLASINKLKSFLPKDVDINGNSSFLPFCGNGFVANRTNANSDSVKTEQAIEIAESSKFSYVNIEHDRQKTIGVITSIGYSEFGSDKPLTKEEILKDYQNKPFNVVYSGILWRVVNPNVTDYVEEAGDPNSDKFGEVSISWEVAFKDMDIMLLSNGNKNLEDGELVTDEKELLLLGKKLEQCSGNCLNEDNKRIIRVIKSPVIALGFGLVEHPAADVSGLLTKITDKITIKADTTKDTNYPCPECGNEQDMQMQDDMEYSCGKCGKASMGKTWKNGKEKEKIEEKMANIENTVSHTQKPDVKIEDNKKYIPMKLASIKDLTDENLKEAKASELTALFDSEIKKISDNYVEKMNEDKNSIKASTEKAAELEKTVKELQSQLNEVIKANAAKEQEDIFTARMASFDENYDLTDDDRAIVGEMIKDLDADKYTSVAKKLETLLAAKKKSGKVFDKKTMKWVDPKEMEMQDKQSKASIETQVKTEDVVAEVIDKGEKSKTTIAATSTVTETLQDRMNKAFSAENWTAKQYRQRK